MKRWTLVAIVLAGCGGDVPVVLPDAGEVWTPPVDAPRCVGPDATPSACPDIDIGPLRPPSSPPVGAWRVRWRCVGGCATYPAPALTTAAYLEVTAGLLRWRTVQGGALLAEHPATGNAGCWRVEASVEDGCRAAYDLCRGSSGPYVFVATWFDVNTSWRQTWEMVSVQ